MPSQPRRVSPANPAPGHSNPAVPTRPSSGPPQPTCSAVGPSGANPAPTRSASAHLLSAWTLGPGGANPAPVRSASAHLLSPWTLGPGGAIPARPRQPTYPAPGQSESLVPNARWGELVLRGGTTPVAFPRGRACFWAPALRFCVGCCRGPAQNKFAPSSSSHCRGSGPMLPPGNEASPGAEGGGPNPLPRTPNHGLRQDQPDRKPPNTQLTAQHRQTEPSNRSLWTTRTIVDNHNHAHKIIRHKSPQYTAYRGSPTNRQHQPPPCGHQKTLWAPADVVDNQPPQPTNLSP
ncbi:hypothetical protein LV75_000575 [Actinokineospora diospyrosa]|uniref:Uncharacterized protein n=1 Tax=Actinokineospora diospyrosa TaxID=103728 RepID=A0ABT1I644_9PSEU|nr:hypothetical protein [Actinokineospora diospyrosa]